MPKLSFLRLCRSARVAHPIAQISLSASEEYGFDSALVFPSKEPEFAAPKMKDASFPNIKVYPARPAFSVKMLFLFSIIMEIKFEHIIEP